MCSGGGRDRLVWRRYYGTDPDEVAVLLGLAVLCASMVGTRDVVICLGTKVLVLVLGLWHGLCSLDGWSVRSVQQPN